MPELSTEKSLPPTALITGAAKRLGRHLALHLAQSGYSLALHFHTSATEAALTRNDCEAAARKAGFAHTQFVTLAADLHDEAQTRALVPQALAVLGKLDAVVNNASLFQEDQVASFGYAALEQHMRSNAGAPVLLAQALHQHLQTRQARGCVVNLLDQKLWNQNPDFFSYTLSKAALEAANTMLALGCAPLLRVVGVAPGLTLTSHLLSDEKFEQLHALSPLGRSSRAEDVVVTVKFALENPALTGTTILVDGGQHLMKFERDFSLM